MEQTLPREKFGRQWLILLSGILILAGLAWYADRVPQRAAPVIPPAQANWFLMLRMPAVTAQYESGIDTMRVRYGEWMDSLSQAGFKPLLMSDVMRRLRAGQGVPPRTVVLVFDPGFRRTYSIVGPILAQHGWPALWMTPEAEMDRGHREYVTYHQARQMTNSGWWDVGLVEKNGMVTLRSQNHPDQHIGTEQRKAWSAAAGGLALNEGSRFDSLERLNVISDWTAKDLVNRVRVEVPIESPMYLTLGQVQNLTWGITSSPESAEEKHFDLATALHRRGTQVAWFGPRRHANFQIDAEAENLVGQLAFRLRWNELDETGIIVTVSNRDVLVESKGDAHTLQVRKLTRSGAGPHRPMKLMLALQGQTLAIGIDGRPPVMLDLPPKTPVRGGLTQLYLYDVLKGSARLDSMKLLYSPHS